MPDDPSKNLSLLPRSSPASSASSSFAGMKRASEPDSPAGRQSKPKEISIGGTIGESEWHRCCSLLPPYPISLVGRISSMADKFVKYLQRNYVQRVRPPVENSSEVLTERKSRFRRRNVPVISLREYVARICNYVVALEPVMLLAVLAYANVLDTPDDKDRNHDGEVEHITKPALVVIDLYAVHRFVITGICVASKALGDHYYSNAFYAKVGGVSTAELDALELELVMLLDWRLQCPYAEIIRYWKALETLDD